MEEASLFQTVEKLASRHLPQTDDQNSNNPFPEGKQFEPPAVGMEFESYDDAYNYYNCYARESGFSVRVKNSWFKRNSREKYGAVLCCSSQGFKRLKEVNRLRKETRTGCPAMIRMRLADSKRWRVVEVLHDHNHVLGTKPHRSSKKKPEPETEPVKLYRPLVIDLGSNEPSGFDHKQAKSRVGPSDSLRLKRGDAGAMQNYLCRMQLTNPNFFYLMDFNSEGRLRNVFWADARCGVANIYFGDVIFFDSSCLSNKYEIPLVLFVSLNHHGQSVLLGCGLLANETMESFVWIFRAFLSCKSVQSPRTVITDRSKVLQCAVARVFPNSHHRFCLSQIMNKVPEKLGGLLNYEAIRKAMTKSVHEALKPFDFEVSWGFMIQRFGIADNEWLRSLYEDRTLWAPVYLKDTFFMGVAVARPGETLTPFFDKYLNRQTPLKEFLDRYELALQRRHNDEVTADMESRNSYPELKTRCAFEVQLSKIYTRGIFEKFQSEVEEMYSCFSTMQVHATVFIVKERVLKEGNRREVKDFEVFYDQTASDVRCICGCFNLYGYLCRHALCVLNFNGVEEVPGKYILSRWKKDYKRCLGGLEQVGWFEKLYRSALLVVEEGAASVDCYKVALSAFEESLQRVNGIQ